MAAGTPETFGRYRPMNKHGIVKDGLGQDQPEDKKRAQQSGLKEQKDAAKQQPQSPGEPAGGE